MSTKSDIDHLYDMEEIRKEHQDEEAGKLFKIINSSGTLLFTFSTESENAQKVALASVEDLIDKGHCKYFEDTYRIICNKDKDLETVIEKVVSGLELEEISVDMRVETLHAPCQDMDDDDHGWG